VDKWITKEIPIFEQGFGYGRATREFDELLDLVRLPQSMLTPDRAPFATD